MRPKNHNLCTVCPNANLKGKDKLSQKYFAIKEKIRCQFNENQDKFNEKVKFLLNRLELICEEIKELEILDHEEGNELKKLIDDDLSNLNLKFHQLKDDLIKLLYVESYLSDEITMEFENGVGGNEAMIFTKEIVEFYIQFCKAQNWNVTMVDFELSNDVNGYLSCTLSIVGKDCFKLLRHEAGVHRVQRVPITDKMNRLHTSTIAIKVIPMFKETEVDLSPKNLEITAIMGTGPGGQLVNKRHSTIRILHLPTNISVKCGEQRSLEDNKRVAIEKIRFKLSEIKYKELKEREDKLRLNQVKSVFRSEKIRTYNFAQDRITDHRIKKDMSNLKGFFNGSCNRNLNDWLEEMDNNHNDRLKQDFIKTFD